ncbi:MAG TPA: hypothetical protein VG936_09995 [Lacunisphaera sp.]|nr:hypothetical protein [Lacunisphaera sp.]
MTRSTLPCALIGFLLVALPGHMRAETAADPEKARLLFAVALQRFALDHDRAKAQEGFAESAAADPAYVPARQNLAVLAEAAHDWAAARRWLGELAGSSDPTVAARAGVDLERIGRIEAQWGIPAGRQAILFDQALAQARALMELGQFSEASRAAETARKLEASRFEPLAILADAAARQGDLTAARDALRQARQVAPADKTGAIDRAIAELDRSGEVAGALQRADELTRKGDFAAAAAEYERARSQAPNDEATALAEANVLLLAGKLEEAGKLLSPLVGSENRGIADAASARLQQMQEAREIETAVQELQTRSAQLAVQQPAPADAVRQRQDERVQEAQKAVRLRESGRDYLEGRGVAKDPVVGAGWMLKAAEAGDHEAMYRVGCCYDRGEGFAANHEQAIEWWRKAAEGGRVEAMFELGKAYAEGNGVDRSYVEAVRWLRGAAQGGVEGAYGRLGAACLKLATAEGTREALAVWEKGAAEGDKECMCFLGDGYQSGRFGPADYAKAVSWFIKGATAGHARSAYFAGVYYQRGVSVPQSYPWAIRYWTQATNQGDADAACQLGICYFKGYGVPCNPVEGVSLLQSAAGRNALTVVAMECLAQAFCGGEGVAANIAVGLQWARQAAAKGSAAAQVILGDEARGRGDYSAALNWYSPAAAQGNVAAIFGEGEVFAQAPAPLGNSGKAAGCYMNAANHGHVTAMRRLAFCFLRGEGMPLNRRLAEDWFGRASQQGDRESRDALIRYFRN